LSRYATRNLDLEEDLEMKRLLVIVTALAVVSSAALATAQWNTAFKDTYKPKSDSALGKAGCVICHTKAGAKDLNPYGKDLKGKPVSADSLKKIEKKDSDKDKATNIAEIKAGTLPGDAKSKPKEGKAAKIADKDPVCGMKIDKAKEPAGGKSTYKGVTYYFCSKNCKQAFDKNPEKYAKPAKK